MTKRILTDIEHHGIITASAIHKIKIDTLLWLEMKEKKT